MQVFKHRDALGVGCMPHSGRTSPLLKEERMKALSQKSVQKDVRFTRPLVVPVPVLCGSNHCLAYRDKKGIWIDYENGEPLSGAIEVIRKSFE